MRDSSSLKSYLQDMKNVYEMTKVGNNFAYVSTSLVYLITDKWEPALARFNRGIMDETCERVIEAFWKFAVLASYTSRIRNFIWQQICIGHTRVTSHRSVEGSESLSVAPRCFRYCLSAAFRIALAEALGNCCLPVLLSNDSAPCNVTFAGGDFTAH